MTSQPVKRNLDGNHAGILRGFIEHINKGFNALEGISQQQVMAGQVFQRIALGKIDGREGFLFLEGQGLAQLRQYRGQRESKGEIHGNFFFHQLGSLYMKPVAEILQEFIRRLPVDLKTNNRQTLPLFQQILHSAPEILLVVQIGFINGDIRITGDPQQIVFLYLLLTEQLTGEISHQICCKNDLLTAVNIEGYVLGQMGSGHNTHL